MLSWEASPSPAMAPVQWFKTIVEVADSTIVGTTNQTWTAS